MGADDRPVGDSAADGFEGSIHIEAAPEVVFEYFTEAESLVTWMGDRAIVDPQPGGRFILHFDDRVVEGRYLEVVPFERVVISWGRRGSRELPPASSTLEVTLVPEGKGTRVLVSHRGLPPSERERHAMGWRHYLPRLEMAATGGDVAPHHVPAELTRGAD